MRGGPAPRSRSRRARGAGGAPGNPQPTDAVDGRINLALGRDCSVFVSGGFRIRQIFRISPAGDVRTVAHDLGDPGGLALDGDGALYVAETALHRVIRISPAR